MTNMGKRMALNSFENFSTPILSFYSTMLRTMEKLSINFNTLCERYFSLKRSLII